MDIMCSLINMYSLLLLLFNLRLMDTAWTCHVTLHRIGCNNHWMRDISTDFRSSLSLPITSAPNSDVFKAIRRLRPSKSVGIYGIPVFNIKGSLDITHKIIVIYFLWLYSPARLWPPRITRFLDHTQRRATVVRTSLYEWSVCRRDLYLTTHNTHNRQTSLPQVGFEPTIAVCGRWDRHSYNTVLKFIFSLIL
jgi:hypothetical protein